MAVLEKIHNEDGLGQVSTTDITELYEQYQNSIHRNFTDRIGSFKEQQAKLVSVTQAESTAAQQAFTRLETKRSRILNDIRKAQGLHPEMNAYLETFADELVELDKNMLSLMDSYHLSYLSGPVIRRVIEKVKVQVSQCLVKENPRSLLTLIRCRKELCGRSTYAVKISFTDNFRSLL